MHAIFAAGFFASGAVHSALIAGSVVAVVSAVVGVLTVIRGQSFAGHAIGDMDTLGGSGALLVGINPVWGFVGVGVVAATAMELFGVQRQRGRDVATGIVLGAALGLSALLLYWSTTARTTTGATVTILFGSLFALTNSTTVVLVVLGAVGVGAVATLYRPLLLSSVSPDLAATVGVPVRAVGVGFLVVLGVSVSLSSVAVGTILSTALLIGPAAVALRLTRRPGPAMVVAALIGVAATWLGILLAYDSFSWPPARHGWPVSFFVVAVIFALYLATDVAAALARHRLPRNDRSCSPA